MAYNDCVIFRNSVPLVLEGKLCTATRLIDDNIDYFPLSLDALHHFELYIKNPKKKPTTNSNGPHSWMII